MCRTRHIRRFRFRCRPATSGLSAFSLVAYRARILLCQVFHGSPVCRFLDQCFPAHCLFHPAFTSFPDRIRLSISQKNSRNGEGANRRGGKDSDFFAHSPRRPVALSVFSCPFTALPHTFSASCF